MSTAQETVSLLESLQQSNPDLLRLAQALALAARVEPQLVRQARLRLLPWGEAGLEADLWFSPLVQARSTLALTFVPELLPALRKGLAGDQALLRRTWGEVITEIHLAGQTPPLILLEEELVYQGLLENDPAAARRIAVLLGQAMRTMQEDQARGPALARWALRTYPRLPARVQQSPEAPNFHALAAYTAGRFGSSIGQGTAGAGAGEITITTTDPVDVWVRLLNTGVELSRAKLEGGNPVPTQRFDTIWLEVGWGEGADARAQTVVVPPSGAVQVAAPPGPFRIRTVAGDVYTLRPQGGTVTESPPPAVLHALLIGIDAYPSPIPALYGCVNDVAAIAGVLTEPAGIGLPPEQVRIIPFLTSAQLSVPYLDKAALPTRSNILAALQQLGETEASPGDRVLLYFAGYGAHVTHGESAQDALVTSDGQFIYASELDELLVAIGGRTDDVTVILDCGFSGGAGWENIAGDRLRPRFLASAALREPPPSGSSAGSGRMLQGAVTSRVGLFASRPHSSAYEIGVNGRPTGVLTAALTAILRAVEPAQRPSLRWADILPDLLDRVTAQVPAQHPLLAGYQERRVFGGPWTRRDPGFAVQQNADGLYQIAAGSLMGVTEGAIIAVYGPTPAVFPLLGSPDDRSARVGELRVVSATRATAVAVPAGDKPVMLPPGVRGRLAQPGASERLRVYLDPPDAELAEMLNQSPTLLVTTTPPEAEVTVRGNRNQGWTISNDVEPEVARARPEQRSALRQGLETYALYNTVLRLAASSNDPELAGMVDVVLLDANDPDALDAISRDPDQPGRGSGYTLPEAPRDARGIFRLRTMFQFCVGVSNSSAYTLHFAVLNCTNGGQVEYLGDGTAAPGASVLLWLDNKIGQPAVATLMQGKERETDRLVVVATTDQGLDVRFLMVQRSVQDMIEEVGVTRGAQPQIAPLPGGVGATGLWTAVMVPWLIEEVPAPDSSVEPIPEVIRPLTGNDRLTILLLAANPEETSRLRLDEEARAVDAVLRKQEDHVFELHSHWVARSSDLPELLLRYNPHIVHFSGRDSKLEGIALVDDRGELQVLQPTALAALFRLFRDNIRCVVLSAPYSQPQAGGIAESIEFVVGVSPAIPDSASMRFVASFYRALGFGRTIQEAFDLGCVEIGLAGKGGVYRTRPSVGVAAPAGTYTAGGTAAIPQLIALRSDPANVRLIEESGASGARKPIPPLTKLSGAQFRDLANALLAAFDRESLEHMVRVQLDQSLEAIVSTSNLSSTVFDLISWAQRTGNLDRLLDGALAENPGNAELRAVNKALRG